MRCVALLVACSLMTSCSWAFVHAPPAEDPTDPGDCTASRGAPLADVALMTLNALTAVVAVSLCSQPGEPNQDGTRQKPCGTDAYVGVGVAGAYALLFGASAVSGFRDTRKCRARRAMDPYRYSAR
jgi:hypothetical protein